jgi:hemerythrin-like domain-containing protein
MPSDRRSFLITTGSSAVLFSCAGSAHAPDQPAAGGEEADEVTPAEDLMREHGVLRRVMYLYDETSLRLDAQREVPLDALASSAGIVRRVIESYHERLEEELVFPRFEKAGKLADLTATLRRQHVVGRSLTDQVVALANAPLAQADRAKLATILRRFNHMYRAHAAREDTVLFPELRALVGAKAYKELGDQLEDKEKEMLGDRGFERAVADVAKLEQAFGVDDLATLG